MTVILQLPQQGKWRWNICFLSWSKWCVFVFCHSPWKALVLCSFAVNPRWGGQMFSWQLWHQSSEWENLGRETQLINFSSMTSCRQHAVCNLISHRCNNRSIFHSGTVKETMTSYGGGKKDINDHIHAWIHNTCLLWSLHPVHKNMCNKDYWDNQ